MIFSRKLKNLNELQIGYQMIVNFLYNSKKVFFNIRNVYSKFSQNFFVHFVVAMIGNLPYTLKAIIFFENAKKNTMLRKVLFYLIFLVMIIN